MATQAAADSTAQHPATKIFQIVSGNFIEMFDFMVYGFYAIPIAHTFFSDSAAYTALLLTLASFGAGFLMRPLGALVLGAYIDRHGRRKGMLVTLGLMSIGIVIIACLPGYQSIGVWAPILLVVARLLQGFSAGVELGAASVYLAEISPPGRLGFYVSWQSASQQVAALFAALLGLALHYSLGDAVVDAWGWRVPFFIGCLIVPVLLLLRRSLAESPSFAREPNRPGFAEIIHSLRQNAGLILGGVGMVAMTTVSFYLISAYMPTYGRHALHLDVKSSFFVTGAICLSNFIWLPIMGAFSDRIGRQPLLIAASALLLGSAWWVLNWVTAVPSMHRLLVAGLWFSFLYASYNSAMVVTLVEIMPARLRATGFSLAYSLATATMGGFTPLVCTWLIGTSHNPAAPGLWLSFAAAIGLLASLFITRHDFKPRPLLPA